MTYKLLYIDDDPNANINVDGFNTTGLIAVTALKPTSFEKQIDELIEFKDEYQGIILDLKLDENLSGDRKAYYSATTLAQQIRTKVSEGEWKYEVPLILFTTQPKMHAAFSGDIPSMELFDELFTKDKITDKTLQLKIHSLIEAYSEIRNHKPNIAKILAIDSIEEIDKRIFSQKMTTEKDIVLYNYSKHILQELIKKPGPLIDELLLAARLGVSIENSPKWTNFLEDVLKDIKYCGIFSSAWQRWWMHKLNNWWEKEIIKNPLASLDARNRVENLNSKYPYELVVAEPIPKASSYRYWTICQGYEKPLDPREGLRINEKEPLPWQETRYMSVEAALERVKREMGLRIHPIEKERFENIMKTYE